MAPRVASVRTVLPAAGTATIPPLPSTGIDCFQFPEWFITQDVESGRLEILRRSRMLVHRKVLTNGKFIDRNRKKRGVVPVRFVRACRFGHIGDINWYHFVHGGNTDFASQLRQLWIDERGTSGDLSEVWIRCECGKAERDMSPGHPAPEAPRSASATVRAPGLDHTPGKNAPSLVACSSARPATPISLS